MYFAFVAICVPRIKVGIAEKISIQLYGIPRHSAQVNLSYNRVYSKNQCGICEVSAISCAILQEIFIL